MFGPESAPLRRFGRAAGAAARNLLALLFLLAILGTPAPVLCLEGEGACAGETGSAPSLASCHDRSPASIPDCESCTDVAAPEESLVRTNRPGRIRLLPAAVAILGQSNQIPAARVPSSRRLAPARLVPTPSFIRTTVLLI